MSTMIRYLSYPLVFGGGVAVLGALTASGVPYWTIGPVVLVIAALIVAGLERVQPYERDWNRDLGDVRVDRLHLIGNLAVSHLSILAFELVRSVVPGADLWPSGLPAWAELALAFAIVDLGLYAVHRASHGVGWLWRLHAIHHSPRRVYWMNGQRRHLVHELLEGAPGLVMLLVLGAPAGTYATAVAIVTLHLLFQHANVAYALGPLRRVFAGAEIHRWHHQRRWRDVQGNYAAVLAVWDHLFGTALDKRGDAPADVGMDDQPDLPAGYLGQLAWPFRRRVAP